ncbi:Putative negative regulator of RcsB-dependent stress response [Colwellia chukchiensis]|uniref:Ancillary SecYEG translocon subunit n=1 Tax=Colwellia chukchiensis TaxID=641665 RepID=A0A1H7JFN4_9GAMM|nr:tetratricopeptide repeat protein [Colwellia chukchiensis]SEK73448.1 Putative negative regulator of RcsB-dependent stress response [Colwellia chukchiensis]
MDIHQTEEQQVEAIKKFWQDNGNAIIAGLVIGLGGFIGLNYYKDHKLQQELNASEAYQNMLEIAGQDSATFTSAGEAFMAEHKASSYAMLTAMALAKTAAENQDWAQAQGYLTTAIAESVDDGMKAIATVRLARVQLQLAAYEQALATLATKLPASFDASVEEIKGDIYTKQGKTELARNAYQAAIDAATDGANPALQMKLDDLAQAVNLSN